MTDVIAVGVDGSEPSLLALRWARVEAGLRQARLIAVIARPSALEWPHDSPQHVDGITVTSAIGWPRSAPRSR